MSGIGVQAESLLWSGASGPISAAAYGFDMAGRVASATFSTVPGIIGAGCGGLNLQTSSMKLQWCCCFLFFLLSRLLITSIDQLDKADAPIIPKSQIYLLAAQCIIPLCEGFAPFSEPIYSYLAI